MPKKLLSDGNPAADKPENEMFVALALRFVWKKISLTVTIFF